MGFLQMLSTTIRTIRIERKFSLFFGSNWRAIGDKSSEHVAEDMVKL